MRTIREHVEAAYPEASKSHRWQPEYGDDNIECSECAVRPYNADAKKTCAAVQASFEPPYVVADNPF